MSEKPLQEEKTSQQLEEHKDKERLDNSINEDN